MTSSGGPARTGVLRDYPLRLWAEQNEYHESLLREFNLLLIGEQSGNLREAAPGRLVALASSFQQRYGSLMSSINAERQQALDEGRDRMDSRVPLLPDLPAVLDEVRGALDAADEFCRRGDLLVLPRPAHLVALFEWVRSELVAQYEGAAPTPWPGPFERLPEGVR